MIAKTWDVRGKIEKSLDGTPIFEEEEQLRQINGEYEQI